jgi:SMI1-KNR4 cell-wall
MRVLTKKKQLNDGQIEFLQNILGKEFPNYMIEFLKEYAETAVEESRFTNNKNKAFYISMFCTNRMIYDYIKELQSENFGQFIPFAVDDGGYVFCLSLNEKNFGNVLLYQTDNGYESEAEAFVLVADTFEEFINGLESRES